MKVTVKIRFGSSKENFENFGNNRYLLYLPFEQDDESLQIICQILSRKIGTPIDRIEFVAVDSQKNWVFDIH